VAGRFQNANGIFHAGDGRLFITEQFGYVVVLVPRRDGTFRNAGVFLDIQNRVACCGEKGMLGLAFPPDYAETGLFYVTYAGAGHTWNLDERRVSADDPNRADPEFRRRVIRLSKPHDYHWGGNMAFGADGFLWIGMGDGGFGGGASDPGDPDNRAQDLGQLFGKMLRIDPRDPDGRRGPQRYSVPDNNPYVGRRNAAPEVWARGFRNPWRWSFDRLTGDLWIADVGMHDWEEINRARAPNLGKGDNYGWRLMEGPDCYNPQSGCQRGQDLKMPLAEYRHQDAGAGFQCAVVGGAVYRGRRSPALRSWFVLGDYCSGAISLLDSGGPNHQRIRFGMDANFPISAIGEGADGEIYIADYRDGASLYRLVGRPAN
jgi:glucose/arabinose dehydrogenase